MAKSPIAKLAKLARQKGTGTKGQRKRAARRFDELLIEILQDQGQGKEREIKQKVHAINTQSKASEFGRERKQMQWSDRLNRWFSDSVVAIEKMGWELAFVSDSGSKYFAKDGKTLRLSDHFIPQTPERIHNGRCDQCNYDYEIIVGTQGWESLLDEACGK